MPGVKPARADVILAGAVVLLGVLQVGGFQALEVTEAGLREGVFFERYLTDRAAPDGGKRRAGVLGAARRRALGARRTAPGAVRRRAATGCRCSRTCGARRC